jgi:RNA polymerase primary sigma factor
MAAVDPLARGGRVSHDLLSAAEEIALSKRIERGDLKAKERMIEANLRLVVAVARAYSDSGVPFADLVQEGTVGLVRAVEKFDYRRERRFSTYAVWWIRRSILDAIGDSKLIRIPAAANRQLAAVRHAEAELQRIGRQPASDAEIANRTQLTVTTVRSLRAAARVTASLDEPVGDGTRPLSDLMADERAVDPTENAMTRESGREVAAMLRLLPERHREVIVRRYGLHDHAVQSHDEIGERLGLGEERTRQIERDALHRLRSIAATTARAA